MIPSIPKNMLSLIVENGKYKKRAMRLTHGSLPMMDIHYNTKKAPAKC